VQIHRFNADESIPIADHGSRFRIGPLTAARADVRLSVFYLDPGDCVGRHETSERQLFCVIKGEGWAAGDDRTRRRVRYGDAVLWEVGEVHEAGSDLGLTAICVEGSFEMVARGLLREIVVVDYDPEWPEWFEQVHAVVWPVVEELALRIDHVGSTAVPGLAAKPIIDLDIVVASEEAVAAVIERLAAIDYRWLGDLGVIGRHAFASTGASVLPEHHLYLVVENNRAHVDHWLLRDTLRADADVRYRYGELKKRNVGLADGDIDVYLAGKAGFVAEVLTRARAEAGLDAVEYWDPGSDS
jgi:GrpB-like predicted nucleotidyltransferase (UPF0157 family)/quercetin dioxygenase-like cupin family protein